MCPMSHVTLHMSGVTCHVSKKNWDKMVEVVSGGSVIYGAYPVYPVYFVY